MKSRAHPPRLFRFSVTMNRDGEASSVKSVWSAPSFDGEPVPHWSWQPFGRVTSAKQAVVFQVWAADAAGAVKIANEHRFSLVQTGRSTTDFELWIKRGKKKGEP